MYQVYVLSKFGKPLMPTKRFGKVKWLLRTEKAKVVQHKPFTIQLTYESTEFTQPLTLGIDVGSNNNSGAKHGNIQPIKTTTQRRH